MIAHEPIGRMGNPEEIDAAVLWLSSDAASFLVRHATVIMCTGGMSLVAFGEPVLAAGQFLLEDDLSSATLNARVELFDFVSQSPFHVNINLAWTVTGDGYTEKHHEHIQLPSVTFNIKFKGAFRAAAAVGTVTNGTTNFTPSPAQSAQLGVVKDGTVIIIRE